jgi:hypothetical protein
LNDFDFSKIDLPTPNIATPVLPDFNENLAAIQQLMDEKMNMMPKKMRHYLKQLKRVKRKKSF